MYVLLCQCHQMVTVKEVNRMYQPQGNQRESMKRTISSIIHSVFSSEAACAKAIGWERQRLNRIVNGAKEPSVSEVAAISRAIGKPQTETADIFLRYWSPNG